MAVPNKTAAKNHHVLCNKIIIVKSMGIMNITMYIIYSCRTDKTYRCTKRTKPRISHCFRPPLPFGCSSLLKLFSFYITKKTIIVIYNIPEGNF